jgi:hypothetical protein
VSKRLYGPRVIPPSSCFRMWRRSGNTKTAPSGLSTPEGATPSFAFPGSFTRSATRTGPLTDISGSGGRTVPEANGPVVLGSRPRIPNSRRGRFPQRLALPGVSVTSPRLRSPETRKRPPSNLSWRGAGKSPGLRSATYRRGVSALGSRPRSFSHNGGGFNTHRPARAINQGRELDSNEEAQLSWAGWQQQRQLGRRSSRRSGERRDPPVG